MEGNHIGAHPRSHLRVVFELAHGMFQNGSARAVEQHKLVRVEGQTQTVQACKLAVVAELLDNVRAVGQAVQFIRQLRVSFEGEDLC